FRADDVNRRGARLVEHAVAVRVAIPHHDLSGHGARPGKVRRVGAERDESSVGAQHRVRAVAVTGYAVRRLADAVNRARTQVQHHDVAVVRRAGFATPAAFLECELMTVGAERGILGPRAEHEPGVAGIAVAQEEALSGTILEARRED